MAKHFTHEQATKMLPAMEKAVREAVFLKHEYEQAERAIQAATQRIAMTGGVMVDRNAIAALRGRRETSAAKLKEAIERVHGHGCLVKDLDLGLVDFPTLYKGEEVYLCWKLGEPAIEWWHGVHEGFQGRKKIDQEFLDNHQGERPN
jgi:hypothetical protein